ncbi:MAG: hypothetical protein ACO1RA_10955 [Planctomycetaceae bacterium]
MIFNEDCRICDVTLDFPFAKPARYCCFCGTNRDGPLRDPLTPIAQEYLSGKQIDDGFMVTTHSFPGAPPDPLRRHPFKTFVGQFVVLISFLGIDALLPPIIYENAALHFATMFGVLALLIGALVLYLRTYAAVACPHCREDLQQWYSSRGLSDDRRVPLARRFRYVLQNGKYIKTIFPRYCPYCGNDVESLPVFRDSGELTRTSPEAPSDPPDAS